MTPFDVIKVINSKGEFQWTPEAEKEYQPFIVNKGLSFNKETLFFANAINIASGLSKKQQFDFYYLGVPKGKRYSSWEKKELPSDDVVAVRDFFNINNERAKEVLSIITNDQLLCIKQKMKKGGKNA